MLLRGVTAALLCAKLFIKIAAQRAAADHGKVNWYYKKSVNWLFKSGQI